MAASFTSLTGPDTVTESVERDAVAVVVQLRDALQRGDAEAAQAVRWLAPRPPGERDLLSDLAAAEGLEPAIRRLARFWARADVRLERVRVVDPLEAEVYERLGLPGESLPIATLVRRPAVGAPWRVVCTNEAYDERFTLWLGANEAEVDDVSWSRAFVLRFGGGAELIMHDEAAGVLGAPEQGWLAHVRGPFVPLPWPPAMPGEDGGIVELTAALTPSFEDRRGQLDWLLRAAAVFVDELGGQAAYFPTHDKLLHWQALEAAVNGELRPDQALRFWARVEELDGHIHTSGLRQLGLPEVEAPVTLLGTPASTAALVRWLGTKLIESPGDVLTHGTELLLQHRAFAIAPGRRGPKPGRSYGRWGALRILELSSSVNRGSRTRLRVPDDLP